MILSLLYWSFFMALVVLASVQFLSKWIHPYHYLKLLRCFRCGGGFEHKSVVEWTSGIRRSRCNCLYDNTLGAIV